MRRLAGCKHEDEALRAGAAAEELMWGCLSRGAVCPLGLGPGREAKPSLAQCSPCL